MSIAQEARVYEFLGQRKPRRADLVALTRRGIPLKRVEHVMEAFQLDREGMTHILGMSPRTYFRRLEKGDPLGAVESDRLVRFLRIAALASEVFDDRANAVDWLKTENRALGGVAPIEILDTDAGTSQVHEILLRIQYGVYS